MKNILDVDLDNLIEEQYKAMKEHIITVLDSVKDMVNNDDFESIDKAIKWSPSGDCMGSDNHYINFAWKKDGDLDIEQVVSILKRLKREMTEVSND